MVFKGLLDFKIFILKKFTLLPIGFNKVSTAHTVLKKNIDILKNYDTLNKKVLLLRISKGGMPAILGFCLHVQEYFWNFSTNTRMI